MTPVTALLGAFAVTNSQKSTSSGSYSFLIIIALFAVAYFLFMRPRSQALKRQREADRQFAVGDEVLTAGGIVGRVIEDQGDRITLETSMGASFTVLRQYIVRRIEEPVPEPEVAAADEPADEEDESGDGSKATPEEPGHGSGDDDGPGDGHDDRGSTQG